MALPGGLTPKDAARNIILGAIEREIREGGASGLGAAVAHLSLELERLQKKWGFDS